MNSIYDEAVSRMKPNEIGNWYSDLHLKVTSVSKELIKNYKFAEQIKTFKSELPGEEGTLWYDIPFAYSPWWDEKEKEHN